MCRTISSTFVRALIALILMVFVAPVAVASADGKITGRVEVEGRDFSGGSFWVVILPADVEEPINPEEARRFAVRTEGGVFESEDLPPGKYLVALVISPSDLKEKPVRTVEVQAPAWDQSRPGATGQWPAYEVEIGPTTSRVEVGFVRNEYAPLPEGFEFAHTHFSDFEQAKALARSGLLRGVEEGNLRLLGAMLIVVSAIGGVLVLRSHRYAN